ncbi:MAG: sulfatase-like hydrolase/transferase [Candidatus Eisenbacteria bacterium]|nr:sulfatase-like hydrolase/transferase [Candidatus Eisenbacteria bacterium]
MPRSTKSSASRHRWKLLIGGLLLLASAGLLYTRLGATHPRLFVLVIIDTLRADHVGCYGHGRIETPHIDRLAAEGILYENAVTAAPVTLPAVATMLTGAYPAQHGIRDNGPYRLSGRWTTVAERFRSEGYRTGAFVSAAVLSRDHSLDQGFETYDDDLSIPYVSYHPLARSLADYHQGVERRAAQTVDRALEWVARHGGEDGFLMVHLFDPHVPRDPPPPFNETYQDRLYEGEIAYVDREVGRLCDAIRRIRGEADVYTLFVADHGEGLGDHEEQLHGDLLYEETLHVPLIIHGPGIPGGIRVREVVRTCDIAPTLCVLAGLEPPEWSIGGVLPGLAPRRSGPAISTAVPLAAGAYVETFRPRLTHGWCELRGFRTDRWKVIVGPGVELYDLLTDPGETRDVAQEHPALCDSLRRLMNRVALSSVRHGSENAPQLDLSREQQEKLLSLGYVASSRRGGGSGDSLAVWGFEPAERGPNLGLPHPRRHVAEVYNRNVADSYCSSGMASLKRGNVHAAAKRFSMALRHHREFPDAYLGLARAAVRAGRPDAAVRYLEEGHDVLPEDVAIIGALSDALVRCGRVEQAFRLVDRAVAAGIADSLLKAKRIALQRRIDSRRRVSED